MRARIWLILLLLGLLFPTAALADYSNTYRSAFNAIFGPEWVHIIAHAILYAIFSFLVLRSLDQPPKRPTVFIVLGIVLVTGCLQEIIQAASQGFDLLQPTTISRAGFDLLIDLAGGLFGLVIYSLHHKRHAQKLLKTSKTGGN